MFMNQPISSTVSRALRGAVVVMVAAALAACGSSKPKPAPLESLSTPLKIQKIWSERLGSVQGPLTLVVADGALITAASDGEVAAFDLANGQRRWRIDTDTKLAAMVGSDGRTTAVVAQSNDLLVYAQGKLLWKERQPGRVITAPLVAGERVFVQGVDRSVRAYDAKDGRWLWQYQRPGGEPLALAASGVLAPFRDTLLVGQGSRLVGLDPLKGTVRFDVNLGTPRGTNEVERLADLVGPIARADDEVCVRAFQLTVGCLELNRGSLRWARPQDGSQPVAADGRLVVGADASDRLSAWKMASGDIVWRVDRFTHRGLSAPVLWGQRVAVGDKEGYLHVLDADTGRTLSRIELDAPLAAAPKALGDTLIAVTAKGTVYALRMPN